MISGRSRLSAQAGGVVYCVGVERSGGDCAAVKSECDWRATEACRRLHSHADGHIWRTSRESFVVFDRRVADKAALTLCIGRRCVTTDRRLHRTVNPTLSGSWIGEHRK